MPADAGAAARARAADAFVDGMSWALRLCAIALAVVTVLCAVLYRRGAREEQAAAAPPPREPSPLHPHPPAWATLLRRNVTAEEAK